MSHPGNRIGLIFAVLGAVGFSFKAILIKLAYPYGVDAVTLLALRDLGPGLSDVALRVCCQLEGLEVAERRMGWAARSGKVVLRIALQRLRRHYEENYGKAGPLIG